MPEANGHPPTPAGAACRAMRQAGLGGTNPGDPRLLALLAQGATQAEFAGIAAEAAAKGKGVAWVLVTLAARRADAAAIALAPATPRTSEPSGALPLYRPEPTMTPSQRAASDAAREAAKEALRNTVRAMGGAA